VALALLLMATLLIPSTAIAQSLAPPTQEMSIRGAAQATSRIAFSSNRDGNFEIYVMNADGSAQTRLTNNPAYGQAPAWSR
jgi:hypothetical protein